MPVPPLPLDINGNRTAFSNIKFGVDGTRLKGLKSVSYDEDHEIPEIYGTSPDPIGRTEGRRKFSGSIEVYQEESLYLLETLSRGGTVGFAEHSHTITLVYALASAPFKVVTDILVGVRVHSPKDAHSEGVDALTVTYSLSIMRIIRGNRFEGLRSRVD